MSLVIPAGQLTRTIIIVRCASPHAAPQIECALDEQASPGHSSLESKAALGLSTEGRPNLPSGSPPSPAWGSAASPWADLNVERGMDRRGHFVRLSFLAPPSPRTYGQERHFYQDVADAPYFSVNETTTDCLPIQRPPQETPSSHPPYAMNMPELINSGPLGQPSAPIMNNLIPQVTTMESPVDAENAAFAFPSDIEMISALDSFMNVCDYSQSWENLMGQPGLAIPSANPPSRQFLAQISEPASPEMSSPSSSSSSGTNSPTTPFHLFLPGSTPTNIGRYTNNLGNAAGSSSFQESPRPSHLSSPSFSHLAPGVDSSPGKPGESRLLPCPQPGCRRQFKSTSTLSGHMKTHAGKGARFACSFPPCAEKFSRRHDQLRHEVYKHGKRCEWVCARCNSFFSYERSLEKHTCTMDKSRRGSASYPAEAAGGEGAAGSER
ncbi:hypothetical protein M0805_005270 [Coniferiporia weirii]|nr:hypothetical protein M0805_005270 [Coniferiporia weirii]